MEHRPLGNTGLKLPILSFGASSLGAEFREVDLNEVLRSVHVALELGMNFIDTSPFYGRGMSEVMLGLALKGVPRDSYLLGTKLGRFLSPPRAGKRTREFGADEGRSPGRDPLS
jgi:L-galactose dehydrogenase